MIEGTLTAPTAHQQLTSIIHPPLWAINNIWFNNQNPFHTGTENTIKTAFSSFPVNQTHTTSSGFLVKNRFICSK